MTTGFGTALDTDIVRRAQQGRRDAQRQLFETFQRAVLSSLTGLCRDSELARDLAQDVFIQAFDKLPQLREPAAIGGWLKQLTIRTALAHFRRPQLVVSEPEAMPEPDARDWLSQTDWLTQQDDIEQLLSILDDHERQLVWLYLVEEYNHTELAELLGLPAATVRQRYHRALQKLKQRSNT
ncbi:sigma-70 family RNA polymerase sigma factor [Pseudidiomarina sp.]|uniref:RNA polymerase sigma factor n=1 Tax=Pseudidiomarina sp. TaxID=2081707 RepID=UPI00299DCCF8|nr:sigma-70 family RNA polymerase sigma factor [Pseudidiomarina sp.]MDX1706413.1 sigma-70 family RNA polymerase sigma factor [Pseudidiomarina sp.]